MVILIVITSHGTLGETGHKTGYWLEELAAPYMAFKEAGAEIVLASPMGGNPPVDPRSTEESSLTPACRRFLKDREAQAALADTLPLAAVRASDYDAVFYPGGHGPLWDLAQDDDSIALIEELFDSGKVVAAVCHGPAVLRDARKADGEPLVAGLKLTGFTNAEEQAVGLTAVVPFSLEDALKAKGGLFEHGENFQPYVVVSGKLVTGQNPASSAGVAREMLRLLR
ncbi:type 1 glutamine amidotransferase domain-containing protein [Fundidesulfovibrio soli]|uniref:type 1 glutamine amidotransferase domain-containing protein n=1 Tax=Fundidesulfovibrio soli TaxID=2922716 RepID=UPI001FAEAB0D|nr:type 1 glutamine amidotransferase domain-containing protein [Fundidesulfovibrio soli]